MLLEIEPATQTSQLGLTIKRDTLLGPLTLTTGFVDRKQTMPILSNVYLRKTGNEITVIANDMEIQASIVVNGEMQGDDFIITLPAKKLQDVLRVFPDDKEIKFKGQDNKVIISCGRTKFSLQSMDATHYPLLKVSEDAICQFEISQAQLKHMLSQVQYCMADKDSRVFLNGMLFEIKDNNLKLVATDAHRLSTIGAPIGEAVNSCSAVIPRKTVLELYRLLEDNENEAVSVKIYPSQVCFETKNKQLITKVIDGRYPDYERVIPVGNTILALIDRQELLSCIDRVAVIGIDKLKTLAFEFTLNQLTVTCRNDDQEDSLDEIEVAYQSEDPLKISFNMSFIRDTLSNSSAQTLQLAFYDADRSILVTNPDDDSFRAVVMPLRA